MKFQDDLVGEKFVSQETICITELERRNREATREMQMLGVGVGKRGRGNFPRNLIDEVGQKLSRLRDDPRRIRNARVTETWPLRALRGQVGWCL